MKKGPCRSLTPGPFWPRPLGPRNTSFVGVVLRAAEAISQAADLSDDQVDECVDQLIEDLQVFVLLEAAETLSGETTQTGSESKHRALTLFLSLSVEESYEAIKQKI